MAGATQQELDSFLAGHPEIENFDLLLPDINGILRGVRAPRADMQQVFESGAYMSASTMLLDSRGLLPGGPGDRAGGRRPGLPLPAGARHAGAGALGEQPDRAMFAANVRGPFYSVLLRQPPGSAARAGSFR